jgi:hypothetical protein
MLRIGQYLTRTARPWMNPARALTAKLSQPLPVCSSSTEPTQTPTRSATRIVRPALAALEGLFDPSRCKGEGVRRYEDILDVCEPVAPSKRLWARGDAQEAIDEGHRRNLEKGRIPPASQLERAGEMCFKCAQREFLHPVLSLPPPPPPPFQEDFYLLPLLSSCPERHYRIHL